MKMHCFLHVWNKKNEGLLWVTRNSYGTVCFFIAFSINCSLNIITFSQISEKVKLNSLYATCFPHKLKPDLLYPSHCSELQPEPWGVPRLPEWEGVGRGSVSPGVSAGGGGDCYRSGPLPLLHHHHCRQPAERQSTPKPTFPS